MHTAPAVGVGVAFARRLTSFGDRPALLTNDREVSYAELGRWVDERTAALGGQRRLVLLAGANDVDTVVWYLAALAGGHPVLLTDPSRPEAIAELIATYDPDVIVRDGAMTARRVGTVHDLHPSLALLLSTSGTTGSPRLVRLSGASVQANAEAIAAYLSITDADVAVTTLPVHYCYGLSVLHSHLLRGAAIVLTSLSVVDACFWELARRHGATSLAGVPYTFELLDRIGFADRPGRFLPSLRCLTQAGGRMPGERVRRYADLGRRHAFELFVMYGQTEATARMAYLPPELAHDHPESVGLAIPGGELRLEPPDGDAEAVADSGDGGVGELVYVGPNVMLGYAEAPADLALGRVVAELRTGDLARRNAAGLFEVVGRVSRFVKVVGLRVDLDRLERRLADAGHQAACAADGDRLVVAVVAGPGEAGEVARLVGECAGLPATMPVVVPVDALPRLRNGKPDHRAVASLSSVRPAAVHDAAPDDLLSIFALVLGRDDVRPTDTFVSLGGDSLSYVEMSVRLEDRLGHLPVGWHTTPIQDLEEEGAPARLGSAVDTSVVLRALAIVAIVGTHGNLFVLTGGAHLLLGLAGFNLGRFQLATSDRAERVRRMLTSVARVVIPSVLWLGGCALLLSAYPWQTALLVNGMLGPEEWREPAWHLWFIEALVAILLWCTALIAVPWLHRLELRWPFWFPVMLAGLGLLARYDLVSLRGGDEIHRAHVVFWLFALGWAAAKATSAGQRLLVTAVLCAAVPGALDDTAREAVLVAGMLVLVWVPQVRLPRLAVRSCGLLASASLFVYLTHWQVYPHFEDTRPGVGVVLSLAAGLVAWQCWEQLQRRVPRWSIGWSIGWSARRAQASTGSQSARVTGIASSPETNTGVAPGTTLTVTAVPTG